MRENVSPGGPESQLWIVPTVQMTEEQLRAKAQGFRRKAAHLFEHADQLDAFADHRFGEGREAD